MRQQSRFASRHCALFFVCAVCSTRLVSTFCVPCGMPSTPGKLLCISLPGALAPAEHIQSHEVVNNFLPLSVTLLTSIHSRGLMLGGIEREIG